jgi:cytochrome c-type biogenesis protein CcmH
MCGGPGCGRQLAGECSCSYAAQMRDEIAMLTKQGRTKKEILDFYVAKFGSNQVLAEPPNEGFDRLAWLAPYIVGVAALIAVAMTARRWTRPSAAAAGTNVTIDPAIDARLDDELRNLD